MSNLIHIIFLDAGTGSLTPPRTPTSAIGSNLDQAMAATLATIPSKNASSTYQINKKF